MYSIDLDSSSSGNLVTNNYMKGCVWEGVFTECKFADCCCECMLPTWIAKLTVMFAMHNIITGNTIIGQVANNAHIHLNGELNYAVDNTVSVNETDSGGISVSSSLSMYGSYALSNVVVANSAGFLYFSGDGGCANYASENMVDVADAGSNVAARADWFKSARLPNASYCIEGVDTTLPVIFRDVREHVNL